MDLFESKFNMLCPQNFTCFQVTYLTGLTAAGVEAFDDVINIILKVFVRLKAASDRLSRSNICTGTD
jgi:hypothetical protein